jgi:hypothetical protein
MVLFKCSCAQLPVWAPAVQSIWFPAISSLGSPAVQSTWSPAISSLCAAVVQRRAHQFRDVPLQVFLALLARSYSWELQKPDEVWRYFPLPAASEGMPTTFRALL